MTGEVLGHIYDYGLNLATTNDLLSIALNACPKLVKLEIAETPEMTTGELHF